MTEVGTLKSREEWMYEWGRNCATLRMDEEKSKKAKSDFGEFTDEENASFWEGWKSGGRENEELVTVPLDLVGSSQKKEELSIKYYATKVLQNDLPVKRAHGRAIITATAVGKGVVVGSSVECSDELPKEVLGNFLYQVIESLFRQGEDPTKCVITLTFK